MSRNRKLRATGLSIDRSLGQLAALIDMAANENRLSLRAVSVSNWSVAEQIEHLRRSDHSIIDAVTGLDTDNSPEGSMKMIGRIVLATGFIPRGRGRAPSAVKPLEVQPANLPGQLKDVADRFTSLADDLERLSASRATIRHPALGYFTASQMLAFSGIHHHHHLKIIRDIRRAAKQ
jgi:hypothetical protein